MLSFGRGLVQGVFDNLRVKARGRNKVYSLGERHVTGYGQLPAMGQGGIIVQVDDFAAGSDPAVNRRLLGLD